jgi:micrococcal nuclease
MRPAARLLALLAAALVAAPAAAVETVLTGSVTRVSDGDTLWLQPDARSGASERRRIKLRLVGLDAPERCQAHGPEASDALTQRVLGREVRVVRRATDDHGRALVTLWLGGEDIGAWLVREGHAWSQRYRGDLGPYAAEEAAARRAHRGLFAQERPIEPRSFRRLHGPCETVGPANRP